MHKKSQSTMALLESSEFIDYRIRDWILTSVTELADSLKEPTVQLTEETLRSMFGESESTRINAGEEVIERVYDILLHEYDTDHHRRLYTFSGILSTPDKGVVALYLHVLDARRKALFRVLLYANDTDAEIEEYRFFHSEEPSVMPEKNRRRRSTDHTNRSQLML